MCGLAGFFGTGTQSDIESMTAAMAHRGPDGYGYYAASDQRVFLGHRRLAIVDISDGHQPMPNEDDSIQVVYNGEIYNHVELRRQLVAAGHRFRTHHSDTEVLVHGYEEWGDDLPRRLNGMFAFAIFDRKRQRLFLARDRFGEKPLYYFVRNGVFAFASELSALRRHPSFSAQIDRLSLQKYFAHGFFPAPNTLYRDAYKLPQGAALAYDLGGVPQVTRYWQYRVEPDPSMLARSDDDLAEELRALLSQAVVRRLMSDVPLGIFLSGGVDSSAILAMATAAQPATRFSTFAIGFQERSFDESAWAAMVSQALHSSHALDVLSLDHARDLIPQVLRALDEPMGDPSIIPTYWLSRFTRRKVTVALSGDGGDELFAGYDTFEALVPARVYAALVPRGLHRGMRRLIDLLPASERNMSLDFKLKRTLSGLSHGSELWNPLWLGPLDGGDLAELFHERVDPEELYSEVLASWRGSGCDNLVDRTLEFYGNFYLPDGVLTKVDRASMMNSLETRAPFLDNDLVEFARRLPRRFKIRRGQRKFLLKHALAGALPAPILRRPKKGFGIPVAAWLRRMPESGDERPVAGADLDWVRQRRAEHRHGRRDHRLFLWCWMALQHHLQANPPAAA